MKKPKIGNFFLFFINNWTFLDLRKIIIKRYFP